MQIVNRFNGNLILEISNADLRNVNLRNVDLYGADLRNVDLYGADLCNANLRNANLRNADLYGADLRNADLYDANLRNANLCDANLCDANLCDANLCGANLCGANLIVGGFRSDGYQFFAFKDDDGSVKIKAGCRRFSIEEAREHWTRTRGDTQLGEESVAIVNCIEAFARAAGWIKKEN